MWRPNSSCMQVWACKCTKVPFFQQFLVALRLESSNVGPWGEMKVQHLSGKGKCEICTGKGWLDNWGQLISRAANHCVFWFHTHTNATAVGAFQHWCCRVYMGHNSWLKTPSQYVQCCSQQGKVHWTSSDQLPIYSSLLLLSSIYTDKKTSLILSSVVHMERILGQHCCFLCFFCVSVCVWRHLGGFKQRNMVIVSTLQGKGEAQNLIKERLQESCEWEGRKKGK